jgi:hypothetical protein
MYLLATVEESKVLEKIHLPCKLPTMIFMGFWERSVVVIILNQFVSLYSNQVHRITGVDLVLMVQLPLSGEELN